MSQGPRTWTLSLSRDMLRPMSSKSFDCTWSTENQGGIRDLGSDAVVSTGCLHRTEVDAEPGLRASVLDKRTKVMK